MQKLLYFLSNFDVFYDPFQASLTTSRLVFHDIYKQFKGKNIMNQLLLILSLEVRFYGNWLFSCFIQKVWLDLNC